MSLPLVDEEDQKQFIVVLAIVYLLLSSFQSAYNYVSRIYTGRGLYFDVKEYWLPITRQLHSGEILYITTLHDNKTPLWYALNYVVYGTGHYYILFTLLITLVNAGVAILIFHWLDSNGYNKSGVLAGLLYLFAVPFVNANIINVRSFSVFFFLLAVLSPVAWKRGALTAVAVLFSQFTVFGVPALLYDGYRRAADGKRWGLIYCATGGLIGIISFLPLLYWGPETLIAGIEHTFFSAGRYVTEHADRGNPFVNPRAYIEYIANQIRDLLFILLPAVLIIALHLRSRRTWAWDTFGFALVLAFSFLLTLSLKALAYYWIPPVVFLSAIVGIGVERWFDGYYSDATED